MVKYFLALFQSLPLMNFLGVQTSVKHFIFVILKYCIVEISFDPGILGYSDELLVVLCYFSAEQ